MRPMPSTFRLLLLLLIGAAGCAPEQRCALGENLVLLRIETPPDAPAVARLGAFWRVNGQRRTKPLQPVSAAANDRLGLCVDPELSPGADGPQSELRLTVVGLDEAGEAALGAELNLRLTEPGATLPIPEAVKLQRTRICSSQGWCWENPLPQGAGLISVASRDPESAWAVGVVGTILHWNGGFWRRLEVPFSAGNLWAVWVDEQDNAWIAGESSRLYRCTNQACAEVPNGGGTGTFYGIAGFDSSSVYAVGPGAFRCNSDKCTPLQIDTPVTLKAVHVIDRDHVLLAGVNGTLLRCASGICAPLVTNTKENLHAVGRDPEGTVYAVGQSGTFLTCRGDFCTAGKTGTSETLGASHVAAPGRVFIAGENSSVLLCEGETCQNIGAEPKIHLTGIYGAPSGTLWLSGYEWTGFVPGREIARGVILRCREKLCSRALTLDETSSLSTVAGSDADNVWLVGYPGTIVHCSEQAGCRARSSGSSWTLLSASGTASELWASGQQGSVVHCELPRGCRAIPSSTSEWLQGLAGATTRRVWTASERGTVSTCTDTGCTRLDSGTGQFLRPMWPAGPDAAWIGGGGATLLRCDSQVCKMIPTQIAGDVFSMWSASSEQIWAAGAELTPDRKSQHGVIFRCSTAGCTKVATDRTLDDPESMRGTGPDDVWVAGKNGSVSRCTSAGCRSLKTDTSANLLSIHPVSADRAYAVGKQGAILSCSGFECRTIASGTNTELASVHGASADQYWVSGYGGTLLRCSQDSCMQLPRLTNVSLGPILVPDDKYAWIVGGAGTVLRYDPERVGR